MPMWMYPVSWQISISCFVAGAEKSAYSSLTVNGLWPAMTARFPFRSFLTFRILNVGIPGMPFLSIMAVTTVDASFL